LKLLAFVHAAIAGVSRKRRNLLTVVNTDAFSLSTKYSSFPPRRASIPLQAVDSRFSFLHSSRLAGEATAHEPAANAGRDSANPHPHPSSPLPVIASGAKAKARDILAAIRTLKAIEQEQRAATAEETQTLARFAGSGPVVNPEATMAAREKQKLIKERFRS
jgi:hypothetical protein